uniref:RING-type domain-containing protein n=1 Tax=Strigamia maritima TaxID=126957 RepID=T1IJA1_STRMM
MEADGRVTADATTMALHRTGRFFMSGMRFDVTVYLKRQKFGRVENERKMTAMGKTKSTSKKLTLKLTKSGILIQCRARLGAKMTTSSTLVETVSINFEDFNESMYDGSEHTPKLLPCSHTVCRQCLERIVAVATLQSREAGTFRCPICRETIVLPRGGVNALPPSFLVNQLLDLMLRQRREVIPKCSQHPAQELLFCETCDTVFCTQCTTGFHGNGGVGEHTVIPFSIAIKRMSEILLYKAHECAGKLSRAAETVGEEVQKLDRNAEAAFELVNKSFQDVLTLVEKRRMEVLAVVKKTRDEKKSILQEQLQLIQSEKEKVQEECNGLQYQVEVRNITKKISELNEKLDTVGSLNEPRENAHILYEWTHNNALSDIQLALSQIGRVRISKTFPALCTAQVHSATMHLQTKTVVTTVDYHGHTRTDGGDPVVAELRQESGDLCPSYVKDNQDGTYDISYTTPNSGSFCLHVTVFERPIKDSPFKFEASIHINPIFQFGNRGSGTHQFNQPVGVAVDANRIYVTDTGNSRIKVLSLSGQFLDDIETEGLEERGGIGLCLTAKDTLLVVNWRSKSVTEISEERGVVRHFVYDGFAEPIDICVNSRSDILVADNGLSCVFMLDSKGKLLRKIGSKGSASGQLGIISSVAIGRDDDVLVGDSRIQVFSLNGEFIREFFPETKVRGGKFGGIAYDGKDFVLATRTEKNMTGIHVYNYEGLLQFVIDSHEAKLRRPAGLAVTEDGRVIVVDLGNDCVKMYRYK